MSVAPVLASQAPSADSRYHGIPCRLQNYRTIGIAVSPISSGFPELAPNPEHVEFFSQISSVFLKALEKPVFLLPWWLIKKKLDGVGPVDNRPSTD